MQISLDKKNFLSSWTLNITVFFLSVLASALQVICLRLLGSILGTSNWVWIVNLGLAVVYLFSGGLPILRRQTEISNKAKLSTKLIIAGIIIMLSMFFVKLASRWALNLLPINLAALVIAIFIFIVFAIPTGILGYALSRLSELSSSKTTYISIAAFSGFTLGLYLLVFVLIPSYGTQTALFGVSITTILVGLSRIGTKRKI